MVWFRFLKDSYSFCVENRKRESGKGDICGSREACWQSVNVSLERHDAGLDHTGSLSTRLLPQGLCTCYLSVWDGFLPVTWLTPFRYLLTCEAFIVTLISSLACPFHDIFFLHNTTIWHSIYFTCLFFVFFSWLECKLHKKRGFLVFLHCCTPDAQNKAYAEQVLSKYSLDQLASKALSSPLSPTPPPPL